MRYYKNVDIDIIDIELQVRLNHTSRTVFVRFSLGGGQSFD